MVFHFFLRATRVNLRGRIDSRSINHNRRKRSMTNSEKKKMLKWNTILWVFAMVLPAFFSIALASAKFPWPMVLPLLLLGPMLASNKMLSQASGDSVEAPGPN
jgi:hypothetical protein